MRCGIKEPSVRRGCCCCMRIPVVGVAGIDVRYEGGMEVRCEGGMEVRCDCGGPSH